MIPKDDYKSFAELAEYAKARAKHSAARRGHQEFAYWVEIHNWAEEQKFKGRDKYLRESVEFYLHELGRWADLDYHKWATEEYARLVHLRKMLVNRGEKVPRLSLQWLRGMADRL